MAGKPLLALAFGLVWPFFILGTLSQESPYRPSNISLDYSYYSAVGSYYNGTINFTFDIEENDEIYDRAYPNDICRENPTLEIEYNALFQVQRPDPEYSGNNSIAIGVIGWDKNYDLKDLNHITSLEAHDYKLTSNADDPGDRPLWGIDVSPSGDDGYLFDAIANNEGRPEIHSTLRFNFTEQCSEASPNPDMDDDTYYNFMGWMSLNSNSTNGTAERPNPRMMGRFDEKEAAFNLTGLYYMTGYRTFIHGPLKVTFSGALDTERSDNLRLNEDQPTWESTILPPEEPSVEDQEGGGNMTGVNVLLTSGMVIFVLGLLMM